MDEQAFMTSQEEDQQARTSAEEFMNNPINRLWLNIEDTEKTIKELISEHDCHATPEDGCQCGTILEIHEMLRVIKKMLKDL